MNSKRSRKISSKSVLATRIRNLEVAGAKKPPTGDQLVDMLRMAMIQAVAKQLTKIYKTLAKKAGVDLKADKMIPALNGAMYATAKGFFKYVTDVDNLSTILGTNKKDITKLGKIDLLS